MAQVPKNHFSLPLPLVCFLSSLSPTLLTDDVRLHLAGHAHHPVQGLCYRKRVGNRETTLASRHT